MRRAFIVETIAIFLLAGCGGGNAANLKPVQQQKAGDYKVTLLTETGTLKQGSSNYTLEFRTAADDKLADVGAVEVAPMMEMAGMAPMMGEAKATVSDTPGRYQVSGNLSMSGLWKINVKFGAGQTARFSLSAE